MTLIRLRNPWLSKLAIKQLVEDFIQVVCDVELVNGQPLVVWRPNHPFFQGAIYPVGQLAT
ncbi:MAG: hypothetical protein U0401_29625 [Anaerolineae bacterium]